MEFSLRAGSKRNSSPALQNHSQAVQFGRFKVEEFSVEEGGWVQSLVEERSMKLHRLAFALSVISLAILTAGCSSTEDKPKEATSPSAAQPQKEPVLYTGREAFNRMMGLALKWSPDAQPSPLQSLHPTQTPRHHRQATPSPTLS